jgi:hypothetical protein
MRGLEVVDATVDETVAVDVDVDVAPRLVAPVHAAARSASTATTHSRRITRRP